MKSKSKWKIYILGLLELEKNYEITDPHAIQHMLRVYGISIRKMLKAVHIFYEDSRACISVGVNVGYDYYYYLKRSVMQ